VCRWPIMVSSSTVQRNGHASQQFTCACQDTASLVPYAEPINTIPTETFSQGCGLGLNVLVSRRSQNVTASRLDLVSKGPVHIFAFNFRHFLSWYMGSLPVKCQQHNVLSKKCPLPICIECHYSFVHSFK